ncbi:hypothetical protein BV923_17315 [Pectobacterium odoriferum]|nr:hypothetical protein RC99_05120 [Pectobacterium carotovorum subsp. carotovorum]POE20788.1 hypothetical protein BV923_17315 [Pectobacterium odoriferum]
MSIRCLVIRKTQFLMFTLQEKSMASLFKLDIQHIHQHKTEDGCKSTTMKVNLLIGDLLYIHSEQLVMLSHFAKH